MDHKNAQGANRGMAGFFAILVFTTIFLFAGAAQNPSDLARKLEQFDATVIPPERRKAAARMLADAVQRRLRESNTSSSTEWKMVSDLAEWEEFRTSKISALRKSLGQLGTAAPLLQRVTGTLSGDGYRIENIIFQSRPGFWITANLYRPDKVRPSLPGILISHAHHTPKENGELQDMGVTWARAGCFVLVPDHLGHGERRQHQFRSSTDYARPFQASRQDYYFRFDSGIQLQLVGESLLGWMAWDLMRGVDLLLAKEQIDPNRIILLGAVAGGGDPAAVTGVLDERITAVAPFNFGGPQPETKYPLPDDAETWFDYAGSGSWESTRNLQGSAADGFLPWVIVGSVAPRRLVYGHEFSWDRERDPVWKRLQTIYRFYQAPDHLAFTHGRGELRGQPPEATHCTHIGPAHRQLIHAALKEWFGIDATESSDRHPAAALRAMTADAERELQPKTLGQVLTELAGERIERAQQRLSELPLAERRRALQTKWTRLLGNAAGTNNRPTPGQSDRLTYAKDLFVSIERIMLTVENSIVPVLLLKPGIGPQKQIEKPGVIVALSQSGKQRLLRERSGEIAALLERGMAICLPDVRGTGETSPGRDRGRRSAATSISSSELMLGGTMLGAQLHDLRSVLGWLRTRPDLDAGHIHLWGDSLVPPNPPETNFQIPRDDDDALPGSPEPLGGLLALLAALYEDEVHDVYVHGGLAGFQSVLTKPLALLPHDALVPGALMAGELCEVVGALAPRRVRLEGMVDGWNRTLNATEFETAYQSAAASYRAASAPERFSFSVKRTSPVQWLAGPPVGPTRKPN